jgi:branched-chain amino acid transport system substrate-binding protein
MLCLKTSHRLILVSLAASMFAVSDVQTLSGSGNEELFFQASTAVGIGLGLGFTGPHAEIAQPIEQAVKMAIEDTGNLLGHPLTLRIEDTACSAAGAQVAAQRFCDDPSVIGVIGYMCSEGTLAGAPLHQGCGKILISPTSTTSAFNADASPYLFRSIWNDAIQGYAAAQFLSKDRGFKRLAILHDGSFYGRNLSEAIDGAFRWRRLKAAFTHELSEAGPSAELLAAIRDQGIEAVVFSGSASNGAALIRKLRKNGIDVPLLATDACRSHKDFLRPLGELAEGTWVTFPALQQSEEAEALLKRYETRFSSPHPRDETFILSAYDAARILLEAASGIGRLQEDGSLLISPSSMAREIHVRTFQGSSGRLRFDEKGNRGGVFVSIYQVHEGTFQKVLVYQ